MFTGMWRARGRREGVGFGRGEAGAEDEPGRVQRPGFGQGLMQRKRREAGCFEQGAALAEGGATPHQQRRRRLREHQRHHCAATCMDAARQPSAPSRVQKSPKPSSGARRIAQAAMSGANAKPMSASGKLRRVPAKSPPAKIM